MKSLITSGGRIWGEVNKGRDRYTSSVRYPFQFQMCIVQQSNLSLEPKSHTLLHARHLEYLNTCSKLLSLTRNALVGLHSKLNPRCRLLMKYDQFRTNKLNMNDKWYTAMVMRPVRLFSSQIGQGVGARANKGWEGYERRERKGREVGALKRVGNWGGRGEIGRNYATILNISQTTRAKSRLKEGSQGKSLGRREFKAR